MNPTAPAFSAAPESAPAPAPVPVRRRFSRTIHLYFLREILKSMAIVMLIFLAVMGCIFSFTAVRDYGFGVGLLLPLLPPAMAAHLNPALPVSLLFATALVYGRFIADREVAAMKSFGMSPFELAVAPVLLGSVASAALVLLNFYVLPEMRFTKDNLAGVIVDQLRYLGDGQNRSFTIGKDRILWVERFEEGGRLHGIFLATEKKESLGLRPVDESAAEGGRSRDAARRPVEAISYPIFCTARKGAILGGKGSASGITMELSDVSVYFDTEYHRSDARTDFKHRLDMKRLAVPISGPKSDRNIKEVDLGELQRREADFRGQLGEALAAKRPEKEVENLRHSYRVTVNEFHKRIAMALMGLTFPLAGVAIALFLNSPNRLLPVFVCLMTVTPLYFMVEMRGTSLSRKGIAPIVFAEAGNLAVQALATVLFLFLRRRTVW